MELTERGARFLLGLMVVLALLGWLVVRPFVQYLALALVIAFLLRKWQARLASATRRPRLAATALVLVTFAFLVLPFVILAVLLLQEARGVGDLVGGSAALAERARGALADRGVPGEAIDRGAALAMQALQTFAGSLAQGALPSIFEFVLGMFVLFFVLFHALVQGERIVSFVRRAVPLRPERMDRLLRESGGAIDAVFKGEMLVALVQGVVAGLGWWFFGYPDPVLWGFVATVVGLLPWVGPAAVIVPFGLWSVIEGDVLRGVGFIVFGVALVSSIDNVLRPILIGRAGHIHPALVLVGVVGGLAAFGLAGLFLGPLILTLLRAVLLVWVEATPPPSEAPVPDELTGSR